MLDRTFVNLVPDPFYFDRVLAQDNASNAHAPNVGTGCFKQRSDGIGWSISLAEAARLVFARSADASGDMNALMRSSCALLEGRGGGRADMAQGGGRKVEKIEEAIESAARILAENQ